MGKLKLTFPHFRHAPAVVCGTGSVSVLGEIDDGETVFLTSGSEAVNSIVSSALARGGAALTPSNHLCKPDGEPAVDSVCEAAEFLRSKAYRRIVAVGGGSVLDWARLAWAESAGLLEPVTGVMTKLPATVERPEFWLVPTTCGTGAEAGDVAVYCSGSGRKTAVISPAFLADKVILDGRFLETIPSSNLAALVADALTHSVEASLSIVPLQLGKEAALSALQVILSNYSIDVGSSQRDRLMEAGFLGGVAAVNCSVGIIHAFAHSVGPDGIPHGLANACALDCGLQFNGETPQMKVLLQRAGLRTPQELIDKVQPIVENALRAIPSHPLVDSLQGSDYKKKIADRMAADIALRTNPRRAAAKELLDFVNSVSERISAK